MSVDIRADQLANLVDSLADDGALAEIFEFLSIHPDSEVLRAVAGKSHLSECAVAGLAADPAISVVGTVINSKPLSRRITETQLLDICRRDPSLAKSVAGNYEDYTFDGEEVIECLITHPDREVRSALANNPFVPRPALRRLAETDPDSDIRETARAVML